MGTLSLLLYGNLADWIFIQQPRQAIHFVWESNYVVHFCACYSNLYGYARFRCLLMIILCIPIRFMIGI